MRRAALAIALVFVAAGAAAANDRWAPFADADVVHIVTQDADGSERDTKVWLVVVAEAAYVRTNDSRWLANIRRGSPVSLALDGVTRAVAAEETRDPTTCERVEAAYLAKYGFLQRVMSALRLRQPTVLRLSPKET